jgi:hypothetical protein
MCEENGLASGGIRKMVWRVMGLGKFLASPGVWKMVG